MKRTHCFCTVCNLVKRKSTSGQMAKEYQCIIKKKKKKKVIVEGMKAEQGYSTGSLQATSGLWGTSIRPTDDLLYSVDLKSNVNLKCLI